MSPRGGFSGAESEFEAQNDEKRAPEVKNLEKLECKFEKSADPLDRRARGLWDVPVYLESLESLGRTGCLESWVLDLDRGPRFWVPGPRFWVPDLGPGSGFLVPKSE